MIKWVGAAYLVWLGIQKWRDTSGLVATESHQTMSGTSLLYKAILINLTNPKSIVFLVALFPQFIDPAKDQLTQLLVLGVTTVTIDAFVMLGYTSLPHKWDALFAQIRSWAKLIKYSVQCSWDVVHY